MAGRLISGVLIILLIVEMCKGISFQEDVTLSDEQGRTLAQFKKQMWDRLPHDYMKEDIYLIKWLRTKDYNLAEAEAYLMNTLKWREDEGMDGIHEEDWSDMKNDFRYSLEGRDKEGRCILYSEIAGYDVRKPLVQGKEKRLLRYVDKVLDEACTLVRTLGEKYHNITRGHLIMDAGGFNLVQHACLRCVPVLLRMLRSYEEHFPECADQIIGIRVPAIAEPLINTGRPLLSRNSRRALKIFGTNRKQWMREMSQTFDFDQLPPQIGGTKIYKGFEN